MTTDFSGDETAPHMPVSPEQPTTVRVQFVMLPDNFSFDEVFAPSDTIDSARQRIGTRLRLHPNNVIVQQDLVPLNDHRQIGSCTANAKGQIVIEVHIDYGDGSSKAFVWPDKGLEVRVASEHGKPVTLLVEVTKAPDAPPFIGGYRNKRTSVVYLNGASQTIDEAAIRYRELMDPQQRHRESQTIEARTRSLQTTRECGTQMSFPGHLVQTTNGDRTVTPRPYFTSDEHNQRRERNAIRIQCFVRYVFAKRRALTLLRKRADSNADSKRSRKEKQAQADAYRDKEIQRRMNPKTPADFATLRQELQSWYAFETDRIRHATDREGSDTEAKGQQQRNLLDKEVRLLQTIDRLKLAADIVNKDAAIRTHLSTMSASKPWQLTSGKKVEVQTPLTLRAQELCELYTGLRLGPGVSMEERLDILLHVKWTVKEFDCALTNDIVDLIDREADMLNRDRPAAHLSGLRQRLANLFYQFACTPKFNPEASIYQADIVY